MVFPEPRNGRSIHHLPYFVLATLTLTFALTCISVSSAAENLDKLLAASPSGPTVEVFGASSEESQLIYSAARRTAHFFRHCGLDPVPHVRVQVTRTLAPICPVAAFGCFDVNNREIRLVSIQACRRIAENIRPYALLPLGDLYESLAVHEIAHQFFQHHLKQRRVTTSAHEYVAYAMQLSSMARKVRSQFLKSFRRDAPSELSMFVDLLLYMSPAYFAALAYDHYSAPGNGCRILMGLVNGTIEFPSSEEFY